MTTKIYLTIGAILALVFGVSFLAAPALVMKIYGIADAPGLMVAYRYFGVALVTAGLIIWPLRGCRDPAILRPVLAGHAVGDVAGVLVSTWAAASGALNALGWGNVLIYLGLLGGAAYCYMATAERPYATA